MGTTDTAVMQDTIAISISRLFTPMPAAAKVIEDGRRWAGALSAADRMAAVVVAEVAVGIDNRRTLWPHYLRDPNQLDIDRE